MSNKTTTRYMPSIGKSHRVGQIVPWGGTNSPIGWDKQSHRVGLLHTLCLLLLMLVLGSEMAWGQTDYSGVYYIASNGYNASNTTSNYYLCPTEGWCYYDYTTQDDFTSQDNGKPFLTTYKCRDGVYNVNEKAVWIVEKHPTQNYYYIKRAFDGKYIVFNGQIRTTTNADRMRVHLEALETPNNNALFAIIQNGTAYNIQARADANAKYWTVNGGNKNALTGQSGKSNGPTGYENTAGIIGIYQTIDANSNFYFEKATIDPPTITNNYDGTFTITAASGATIYYTTNGDTPTTSTTTTGTTSVNVPQTESMTVIKAIAKGSGDYFASGVTTYNLPQCAKPVITISGGNVTITCATEGATIHYTTDGTPANSSSTAYTAPFAKGSAATFRAIATKIGYVISNETTLLPPAEVSSSSQITDMNGNYILASNFSASGSIGTSDNPFTGTIDGAVDGELITRSLSYPLVAYANGATIKNVILDNINITSDKGNDNGNTGAICNEATGATRIYNCGVLATGANGSTVSGSGHVGSIVGSISGNTRVINCYSYATVNGGTYTAGIVGYNPVATTQTNVGEAGMVMNCMFYGDITGSNISPVYGGVQIDNAGETGVNNYNYYRRNRYDKETDTYVDDVTFDNNMAIADFHRSWPADAKYLTRFEYYRSILNSNKKLCTWWVNGTNGTAPSDGEIEDVGIAKWVLDLSIAPYPILKKWGKYPSVINQDPNQRVDPSTKTWVNRASASNHWGKDMAPDTEGQILGTVTVTIDNGRNPSSSKTPEGGFKITAMDTEYNDYCYGKIQLPYYNEIFGNPNGDTWEKKYGGNYTDKVVTGWIISGGSAATDYNYADRNSYSGRVYAQGGYFYVPKGVTSISITAQWADAVYLCNKDYSIDRVNVAAGGKKGSQTGVAEYGSAFTPAGTISNTFQGQNVYTTIKEAIGALSKTSSGKNVYNQAIVLIGNVQVRNHSSVYGQTGTNTRPFTLMSADLDFDNEPDNCLELQFRNDVDRPGVQPIRFDFLPVPELGLAIRTNKFAYAIGIMVPLGHFEITETAFMHTTQFEYDAAVSRTGKSPVIINGGEHEQFTKRKQEGTGTDNIGNVEKHDRTSYFLLGGNAWIHRFAPGAHPNVNDKPDIYLFPVNVIGGQVKELYLTGLYRPELPEEGTNVIGGTPRCYIDGGKFDIIAGAGYDKVKSGENVTFKINHSLIDEFYGGGINGSNPISGDIEVTINNSRVDKYCGGPKVGNMAGHKITTNATGTTFGVFYGGGNGGNSYYRQLQQDSDRPSANIGTWDTYKEGNNWYKYNWNGFNPLNLIDGTAAQYDDDGTNKENKGFHAEYEFEVFNQSNGLTDEITQRGFIKWIQFGITTTGDVESTLENCKVLGNFYGGGNLASVSGDVTSILTNTQVDGSVFGAGYSAAIPTFQVQNKGGKTFPSINDAGVITDGSIPYLSTVYEWTNDDNNGEATKTNPTYSKEVGGETKWYCYTWNSLENLGAVTGNVTLTVNGNTVADANGKVMKVDCSVYGGGEESAVGGNTEVTVEGGTIGQNVYGGGNLGSVGTYTVSGSTYTFTEDTGECTVNITGGTIGAGTSSNESGNVFGAGKGIANTFQCEKAMVYQANVNISGGTVKGTVYGGGEIGRVENDTEVKIGDGEGGSDTPTPNIQGNVFGAGKGLNTHGYSALVRGNSKVTVEGDAKVDGSIYGGGEISSVGRYTLVSESNQSQYPGLEIGMPGSLANSGSGECTVIVQGHATIGPNGMQMTATGGPDDRGHVFGAGMGATPDVYTYADKEHMPKRMMAYTASLYPADKEGITWEYADDEHQNVWEYFNSEAKYLTFIETMALTTQTEVTVDGSAFVKGSVYGGSENGFVQHDTKVMIKGGQIGAGAGESSPYADNKFVNPATTTITSANTLKACATWTYTDDGAPYDKFAGSTGYDAKGGATTATDGHTFYGNVFGGGSGFYPYAPGKWHRKAGSVGGDTRIEISGGHILSNVYGGNEQTDVGTYTHDANDAPTIADGGTCTITMTGGTIGVPRTATAIEALPTIGHLYGAGKGDKRILFNTWTNVGATSVSVSGGTVYGNVYGGGEDGHVMGNAVTTISETDATNKPTVIGSVGNAGLDGNVFGGGQGSPTALTAGVVGGSVNLNVQGGHMLGSVYGGGRIASVGTFFAMATDPRYGKMQEDVDDDEATTEVDESVTHGHLTVNLTGGTIEQNVYGGCMGTNAAADADAEAIAFAAKLGMSKTVAVNLNQGVADNARGCAVKGDIFGCNNTNASPQQAVTVYIYGTQNADKTQIANTAASGNTAAVTDAKRKGVYDVRAVYGGGNLAAYTPVGPNPTSTSDDGKNTTYSTNVIIDGCGRTSIQTVYGGGNAASTPATSLTVNGTYEIEEVFGGGNGKDNVVTNGVTKPNPGANVGYKNYSEYYQDGDVWKVRDKEDADTKEERLSSDYCYGSGKASVNIFGGTVHRVFGGSNTKGNVRQTAVTMLDENSGCDFCVDEAYGGGKEAPMDAEAKLHMACIPGLSAAYGGAEAADIQGDVTLNITNGTFNRVFGGNNLSGTISGSLTVNIEEIGCKPIFIGELYGGGNQAGYSIYGYDSNKQPKETGTRLFNDPQVNVKSFTSIGDIYGGGYGETAKMVGNPTVNVSVAEGDWKDYVGDPDHYNDEGYIYNATGYKGETLTITDGNVTHDVVVPSHDKGKIGAINNVFGGGNAAKVIGNTNVNIGTLSKVTVRSYVVKDVTVGASVEGLYTRTGEGTVADPYRYTEKGSSDVAEEGVTYYEEKEVDKPVIGADIRGNVYGGGNNAAVTGNTNVVIGERKVTE